MRAVRDAKTGDPATPEQPTVCPKCGGALEFTRDRMGYGVTIEQCEHVARCGHWRTLEAVRIPAHTAAPKAESRPKAARNLTRVVERNRARGLKTRRRVLDELTSRIDLARTVDEMAPRIGLSRMSTKAHLDALVREGLARRRPRRVPGVGHRPPFEYWRVA